MSLIKSCGFVRALLKNKDLKSLIEKDIKLIDKKLDEYLIGSNPKELWQAMRYTALLEGKRLRPILALESTRICGADHLEKVIPSACAIEMIHAYSLIHDDLPSMDNDDFRRGKPSNHKAFGEAVAVLAGDALNSYVYQMIIEHTPKTLKPEVLLNVINIISKASGPNGIVGGQVADILAEGKDFDENTYNYICEYKTAGLFEVAMKIGAVITEASKEKFEALSNYGKLIGIAFQIADDILDITSTQKVIGKTPGKDLQSGKATYPIVFGVEKSIKRVNALCKEAIGSIKSKNIDSALLLKIAEEIITKVSNNDS